MRIFSSICWMALSSTLLLAADVQPEQKATEAELLKDVKVPAGFDATIFAAPPMANYPVFVAAAPDGTLYVSSDGNGSLGRDPHRGRILRLRDLDGDGRADEVKEFVKDVDSPRGLVWDHDRLYLLHPPHISEYIDKDGDGVSDEERILVKNIAFTFKDRPADHSSNGMELGIDGWLYCAIGDFGFMEAEGTDGKKVQLRGGGVVRVRPDGTGLHIYSHGTRNILEPAVSPLLDVITRDNTNDGGGWDIRLHHNTGLANHGYPSLYKNFNDEIIQPLADYGGGSGCGAAWIDEPGIPEEWNNTPFTCDWGRGWVYSHRLTPNGATFKADQKEFIGLTRPTDLDVDGNSRIYVASWKGATFNWAGPDVGYIVQLRPKNFTPKPLPDYDKLTAEELVSVFNDESHRRRLEAQRAFIRKGGNVAEAARFYKTRSNRKEGRVAALFGQVLSHEFLGDGLAHSSASYADLNEFVLRLIGEPDRKSHPELVHEWTKTSGSAIVEGLKSESARSRLQAAVAAAFRNQTNAGPHLAECIIDNDKVVAHTAIEAMKRLGAADACWSLVDSSDGGKRVAALRVLQGIHRSDVVDGLTTRLQGEKDSKRKGQLFTALARLYSTDAKWKGDSWGTRPDTSGPYYEAANWEESPRILRALNDAVQNAKGEELAAFATELNRHKVQSEIALEKVMEAAKTDAKLIPAAIGQVGRAEKMPAGGEAVLAKAAVMDDLSETTRAQAILAIAKNPTDETTKAALEGLARLQKSKDSETEGLRRQARSQFIRSKNLNAALLEVEAASGGDAGLIADAALLSGGNGRAVFEKGSAEPKRKVQLLKAMALLERPTYREEILAATEDLNEEVAKAARETAKALRLDERRRNAPKIESMSVTDAIAAVVKAKGDVGLGKKLFTQQTCVNCHTVTEKEPQRGPYLGNIAATYKRPELAEAILVPNKSLAQGFVANHFVMKDGEEYDGFVTLEAADKVVIRDTAAQEHTFATKDIVKREKLEKSLMPDGLAAPLTVQELASLLDYLESLNTK